MVEKGNDTRELYWHYTDAAGLIGILESGTLHASSTLFMNDLREISLGTDRVKQAFDGLSSEPSKRVKRAVKDWLEYTEKAKGRILHTFLLCAAKDGGDSLAMWRGYGRGTVNYAIGLDPQHQFDHKSSTLANGYPSFPVPNELPWRDVVYSEAEHLKVVHEAFNLIDSSIDYGDDEMSQAMMSSVGELCLDSAAYCIKDQAFQEEKEVRLIVSARDATIDQFRYRASRFGVTPYLEINAKDELGYQDPLPIRHVRVGPTQYPEHAELALRSLLQHYGYGRVKYSCSTAPFR